MVLERFRPYMPNYRQRLVQDQNVAVVRGEDVISHLPESILSRILSHLPTRDAVKTSVLSRDWEYKWTLVYNLSFKDEAGLEELNDLRSPKRVQFMSFVERVLLLCGTSTLEKFELSLGVNYEFYDATRVKLWLVNVLWRNVQSLNLVNIQDESVFPRYFFSSDSLMHLKLKRCSFKAPSHVCFSNLRTLSLLDVKFRNADFSDSSKLVLTLPALEELRLGRCKWRNVKVLTIDAPRLVVFEILYPSFECDTDRSIDCKLEICQVNLEIFRCWALCFLVDLVLASPSTADYVELRYEIGAEDNLYCRRWMGFRAFALLGGFSAVTSCLEVSRDILVVLADAGPPCPLPVLEKLAHLKLTLSESSAANIQCNKALVNLLKKVPALELLTISMWRSSNDDDDFSRVDLLPANFLSCLKVIKFQYFYGSEDEMQLLKFLLHHASSLDVMMVGSGIFGNQPAGVKNRMLKFPRGSSHASIVFSRS